MDRMTDRESEMAREAERLLYEHDYVDDIDEAELSKWPGSYVDKREIDNERMGTDRQDRRSYE